MDELSGFEKVFPSIFSICVGIGMIGQWIMFYLRDQIPELDTEPMRIKFHLAAELITAVVLILGGTALIANTSWGKDILLLALGMLLYTLVVSSGYFAQRRQPAFVGMFAGLFLLTLFSLLCIF